MFKFYFFNLVIKNYRNTVIIKIKISSFKMKKTSFYFPTTENENDNKRIKFQRIKQSMKFYNIIIFILLIGCLYSIVISTYLFVVHVNFMSSINMFVKPDILKNNTIDFIESIYNSYIVKRFINNTININSIASDLID